MKNARVLAVYRPVIRLFLCVAAAFAVTQCKTTGDGSQALNNNNAPPSRLDTSHVVLVYMGGFSSCGSSSPDGLAAMEQFRALTAAVQALGKTVHTLRSCFDGMSSTTIRWMRSGQGTNVYGVQWDAPFGQGGIASSLAYESNDFTYPIVVIGHSYGGWLSSNLVAHLSLSVPQAQGAIVGLYTIDPVSPYHCNQAGYAASISRGVRNTLTFGFLGSEIGGCVTAPPQITQADSRTYPASIGNSSADTIKQLIRRMTSEWRNYFQTLDYLHSSSIPDAGGFPVNRFVNYSRPFVAGTSSSPHIKIHVDPVVWNSITSSVTDRLGSAGGSFSLNDPTMTSNDLVGTPATREEMARFIPTLDTQTAIAFIRRYFEQNPAAVEQYRPFVGALMSQWAGLFPQEVQRIALEQAPLPGQQPTQVPGESSGDDGYAPAPNGSAPPSKDGYVPLEEPADPPADPTW